MAVDMRAEKVDDPTEYIREARESAQFEAILDETESYVESREETNNSAICLYDRETNESAHRVDFLYDVVGRDGSEDLSLNVQVFFPEKGMQETVGYLRDRNLLLTEFYTNHELMPDCVVDEWDGDVVLEARDYELENILE
ncbi:hypothetical protein ACFO0N_15215 [Halobium salinum]|uniref:Uncharacterized protein n=1 Tax=Halobium salinum TaxID=1364940 RepID=A0ABD5PEE4_9EURY|nr:hypothetical protein [Halobium salinum]